MKWQPSDRIKFLLKHGSLIVAINSFAVAVMSLWLTIDTARLDRKYKEVSITPSIDIAVDSENFTIQFRNSGLGPALIKRIVVGKGEQCLDSRDVPENEWPDRAAAVFASWEEDFIRRVLPNEFRMPKGARVESKTHMLSPETVISQGASTIYTVVNIAEVRKALRDVDMRDGWPTEQETVIRFQREARKVPIDLLYCTLTGITCFGEDMPGCRKKLK